MFQAPHPAHWPVQVNAACPHSEHRYEADFAATHAGYVRVPTLPARDVPARWLVRFVFDQAPDQLVFWGANPRAPIGG